MDYLKIGAIGSRRFYCFDINSEQHEDLKGILFNFLMFMMQSQDQQIFAYSGLNLGLEQDFLWTCSLLHIPYEIVLPYQNAVPYTEDDRFNKNLDLIIENASKLNYLSHNIYSVKKNIAKRKYITDHSDIILCNDKNIKLDISSSKSLYYV